MDRLLSQFDWRRTTRVSVTSNIWLAQLPRLGRYLQMARSYAKRISRRIDQLQYWKILWEKKYTSCEIIKKICKSFWNSIKYSNSRKCSFLCQLFWIEKSDDFYWVDNPRSWMDHCSNDHLHFKWIAYFRRSRYQRTLRKFRLGFHTGTKCWWLWIHAYQGNLRKTNDLKNN